MASGMDTRETRDFARETKFLISADLGQKVLEWARKNLAADPSGGGPFGDEYATTSLYFETKNFDVYHRRKSYGRSKFRVRRYGFADIIFLERKFRTDRLLAKRRTIVPLPELEMLSLEDPDRKWRGYWFHRRLKMRGLRPISQMSYDRIARLGTAASGQIRLTIDHNLRVLPMFDRAFIPGVGLPLIDGQCIMEMKYRVEVPPIFKQVLEEFNIGVAHVSKYRLGLAALDFTPKPTKTEPEHVEPPQSAVQ